MSDKNSIKKKCFFCKKKKLIMLKCTCGNTYCLDHYSPGNHNCKKSFDKNSGELSLTTEATGAFRKVDKI
tara:strand:- start:6 stop:215 length:210 start_codon:yes stop_codon:yes gene_type:complete